MSSDDEWPKEWDDITGKVETPDEDTGLMATSISTVWMQYSAGMRGYDGTLYVTETIGREVEEESSMWMPIEVYMEKKMKQMSEEVLDQ